MYLFNIIYIYNTLSLIYIIRYINIKNKEIIYIYIYNKIIYYINKPCETIYVYSLLYPSAH